MLRLVLIYMCPYLVWSCLLYYVFWVERCPCQVWLGRTWCDEGSHGTLNESGSGRTGILWDGKWRRWHMIGGPARFSHCNFRLRLLHLRKKLRLIRKECDNLVLYHVPAAPPNRHDAQSGGDADEDCELGDDCWYRVHSELGGGDDREYHVHRKLDGGDDEDGDDKHSRVLTLYENSR